MNSLIEDDYDNVKEFQGGTLQLNTVPGQLQNRTGFQNDDSSRSSGVARLNLSSSTTASNSGSNERRGQLDNEPAILSGADVVSPITSSSSASDRGGARQTHLLPQYHIPFAFDNAQDFFTYRTGLVEAAIDECNSTLIFPNQDGRILGSWLLTEISLWDYEKERLVTLTDKALISVKYDFIALRQLDFRKVPLESIDTVVIGDLVYPPASIVPRLNGLANGVSTVVRDCIWDRFNKNTPPAPPPQQTDSQDEGCTPKGRFGPINFKQFESRNRNMRGVRAMWNRGKPLSFVKKWNPFDNDVPMNTFSSHPLFWHKDVPEETSKDLYDSENFARKLVCAVEAMQELREAPCQVHHSPIVLPSYVGLTSLVHNKNSLGFFKVRGKFSF